MEVLERMVIQVMVVRRPMQKLVAYMELLQISMVTFIQLTIIIM